MNDRPLLAALACSMALLVTNVPVWAQQPGNYIEAWAGFTRAPDIDEQELIVEPGSDLALGVAYGTALSENSRVEAELSYAKVAFEARPILVPGAGFDATADGFTVSANFLFDVGANSSPANFEIGIGLGWTFFDEACFELEGLEGFDGLEGPDGLKICTDVNDDDWTVQGIVGGSYALSDTGAVVVRYRMQNTGGFSSEDRLHVFTVGYRHHF